MVHKLVWMALDSLKDVQHIYFDSPAFTKSAADTFIVKSFGDRVKLIPRIDDFKGKQAVVLIKSFTEGDKLESIVAEVKDKLSKTECKNTYILLHGLIKSSLKADTQASLAKSYVK